MPVGGVNTNMGGGVLKKVAHPEKIIVERKEEGEDPVKKNTHKKSKESSDNLKKNKHKKSTKDEDEDEDETNMYILILMGLLLMLLGLAIGSAAYSCINGMM
eukprot:3732848-Pyramimonas_sp.AAC.1